MLSRNDRASDFTFSVAALENVVAKQYGKKKKRWQMKNHAVDHFYEPNSILRLFAALKARWNDTEFPKLDNIYCPKWRGKKINNSRPDSPSVVQLVWNLDDVLFPRVVT